jgi:hypothetical protein
MRGGFESALQPRQARIENIPATLCSAAYSIVDFGKALVLALSLQAHSMEGFDEFVEVYSQ